MRKRDKSCENKARHAGYRVHGSRKGRKCTLRLMEEYALRLMEEYALKHKLTSQTSIPIKVATLIWTLSVMISEIVYFDITTISFKIVCGVIRRFPQSQRWSQGNYSMISWPFSVSIASAFNP